MVFRMVSCGLPSPCPVASGNPYPRSGARPLDLRPECGGLANAWTENDRDLLIFVVRAAKNVPETLRHGPAVHSSYGQETKSSGWSMVLLLNGVVLGAY